VAKVTVDEYLRHLDREEQLEQEERQKIVSRLQVYSEVQLEVEGGTKGWNSADTNLFECLAASNRTVDERKYEQETGEGSNPQTLFNDLESISETILRKAPQQSSAKAGVDRELLKKELQEIDDELREIE
jgi:hypothetical protein